MTSQVPQTNFASTIYVEDMLVELHKLAQESRADMLVYMLEMAIHEARLFNSTHANNNYMSSSGKVMTAQELADQYMSIKD